MKHPIDMLKSEHRVIERALGALDGICQRMEQNERIPSEALSSLIDFFRMFADRCHHGKEEAQLFPALVERGIPREGGPIGVMLYEHEVGRGLVKEFSQAAEAYHSGDASAGQQIISVGHRYIELLTQHIYKEDNILFRMAEQVLDEPSQRALGEAFEQVDSEFGDGFHQRYEQLANALEQAWSSGSKG
ncbi:MAG: hemerythrin domain-containing protein [Blastocatellia bacterium]|nr:hemerythrin domain-containing protein [Blastocatellia bacterium]